MSSLIIEAVASSPDDCVEAEAGGADRIELCSALFLGGLTPSLGTVIASRAATQLPIVCMIRPRAGGFRYTAREFASMERDVEAIVAHGVQGIVFGILDGAGGIDVPRCAALIELAQTVAAQAHAAAAATTSTAAAGAGRATADVAAAGPTGSAAPLRFETVFHRAFDVVADPHAALDALIDLGVTRVLTSGRARTALDGAPFIRSLANHAAGRIEILPGGGIREGTVADVLFATGLRQVHLGPFVWQLDPSGRANPGISFSSNQVPPEGQYALTDREALRRVRRAGE